MMSDLLVLGYHAVSESWQSDLAVTPASLERQLGSLVRRGYRGARFEEATSAAASGRTLVVTFDDAYRSVLELALPIMQELGLPGVVFAPTRFTRGDQLASWSGVDVYLDGPHAHELAVMSWEELAGLRALGWEVGSHTRSHPHLTELDDDTLAEELEGSRADCEAQLGGPCASLAYPYGDTDARVIAAARRAGYVAAAGMPRARALNRPAALNWPRVGIFYGDDGRHFRLKVSPVGRRLRTRRSAEPKPIA
jgi:peptidoglycan/xylan/chitin deacetylase (PgdA/CDA1 family)